VATVNAIMMLFSAAFFLVVAAVTRLWVPDALMSAVGGVSLGVMLGLVGLWLTHWEPTTRSLHYTPNRWLVLAITVVVAVRVLYGFWRGAAVWGSADSASVIDAFGIGGSLAAGGTVIGYYVAYGIGLRRRISRWQRRPLRVMS
jgi:hypothetical protein